MEPPENCSLVLTHERVHLGAPELVQEKQEKSTVRCKHKEHKQPQSWHSWAPLNCSALMAWWDYCTNRLQTTTGWPQQCVAERRTGWLKGKEGQQCVCTHCSLVFITHLVIDEPFFSLYVEFQSCCGGDRERIDSAVKTSLCGAGVWRAVVVWQSLVLWKIRVLERKSEWKASH